MAATSHISRPGSTHLEATVILRFWHLISLDAPTVAVVWVSAFAWANQVVLPWWVPAILALGSWSVYVGDRLLDALSARTALQARHHFNWRHRRVLAPMALFAFVAAICLAIVYVPAAARVRNTALAAAACLYFIAVHRPEKKSRSSLKLPKEALVGILFTLACVLPVWARTELNPLELVLPTFLFTLLAWLNCHLIDRWESTVPQRNVLQSTLALSGVFLVAAILFGSFHQPRLAALLGAGAAGSFGLGILDLVASRLAPITLRAAADLVLLSPAILLTLTR